MADDVIVEKVFNFICGSGGFAELSSLLKDSSPLKSIGTEQEKKNWLKTQARGRFVLVKDYNDDLVGVRIDLRKKICHHYLTKGSCPCAKRKCKFWHICKGFVEGNCDGKCSRSHNFFDTHNNEKAKALGLADKFPNGTVRNIVAWSLPQICQLYLKNECNSDKCMYLHLCSNEVRGLTCCALSHNLTDTHNKKILKQYDLVPHQSMKVDFVRSSILDLKEQRSFGKGTGLNITSASGTTLTEAVNNLTSPTTSSTSQIVSKKKSISSQATNDPQSSTASQEGTSNNTAMNSKQNEIGSSSKSETGNKKTQQSSYKAKQPRQETKDQEPVINNLTNISTASTSCKNSPEFLNIQAEEEENGSDSSSEENKTATSGLRSTKLIDKENKQSQLNNRHTTHSSPGCSSAAKSSGKEPKSNSQDSKTKSEPQKNKNLVDSSKSQNVDKAAAKDPSSNRRSGNVKKTLTSAVPSDLPADEASEDFVKKWVMGEEEKQSSDIKQPDSLASSKNAVKVERQRKVSISSSCSSVPDPQKCTPSKKAVFDCILKDYDGTVSFAEISNRQDLFTYGCGDIAAWFKERKESFLLNEGKDGTILEVSAFCRRARLCFNPSCSKNDCQYLHICRNYIAGFCRFGERCQRGHSFQYDKDGKVLSKLKLNGLAEENLRKVVQLSIPQVCLNYNKGGCARGQSCNKIHICKDVIRKQCEDEEDCGLQHQNALLTAHSTAILQKYGLTVRDGNVGPVFRALLVCDEKPAASKDDLPKGKETGHVHQDRSDAPICSDFLLGKCKRGIKCSGHHCSLPYHWQYKVPEGDEWKSFSETDNERLEKLYCDVNQDSCLVTGLQIAFESEGFLLLDDGYDANFLLDNKMMILQKDFDVIAPIRRLSSESHISNPANPVATTWTWYWKDEHDVWREYGVDYLGKDLQQSIEEEFLKSVNCAKFKISDQDYMLYYYPTTEMHQENVRYGTVKKVRRRPAEFKSRADIQDLKRSHNISSAKIKAGKRAQNAKVPSHWTPMPDTIKYKRVSLMKTSTEYKEVEKLFTTKMKKTVVIDSIERVQNPYMWEKYQRKKEHMKSSGHKLNEKSLFHGTSPETVEAICKQNFDWRLHGKNATMYGQGSYFALNSSYSDAYAKGDENSHRFMFVAKVLVGIYTKGESSYRRPPPKDPTNPASDLYDSCVNDRSSPTIFVVFESDQFYPEYIIKYSQEDVWYSVAHQAAYGLNQPSAVRRPVSKPRTSQVASSQPRTSQVHATTAAGGYSSGLNSSGASPYSTASGYNAGTSSSHYTSYTSSPYSALPSRANASYSGTTSSGYASPSSSTYRVNSPSTTSTPYSGTSSSGYASPSSSTYSVYNSPSTTNAPYSATPSSNHSYSSSSGYRVHKSPSTTSTPYSGTTSSSYSSSAPSSSSTRHQSASSGSYSQYRSSAHPSGGDYQRSSSRDKSKCSVM